MHERRAQTITRIKGGGAVQYALRQVVGTRSSRLTAGLTKRLKMEVSVNVYSIFRPDWRAVASLACAVDIQSCPGTNMANPSAPRSIRQTKSRSETPLGRLSSSFAAGNGPAYQSPGRRTRVRQTLALNLDYLPEQWELQNSFR